MQVPSAAWGSASRLRSRPHLHCPLGRSFLSTAMVRSASMRWKSTPRFGTAPRSCSSYPTMRHGTSSVLIRKMNYGGRVVGTTLRHSDYAGLARALGAYGERVEKPSDLQGALQRALQNAPAVIDVVTSQSVLSSDAQKGLGFVPDYQALTTWDEAERKRREAR